jgi:glycosyltransferase involved in cell wall biosynthesis
VEEEGLADRVFLPGVSTTPAKVLNEAALFVLSSRFEGFPNALCEAMWCGLPVIATDCPSGPRDIVRNGVDGYLVPCEDVEALARALDEMMDDSARRSAMGTRATEIGRRFHISDIMARWDSLILGDKLDDRGND